MSAVSAAADPFAASRRQFEELCVLLGEERTGELEHAELEVRLADEGRALLRQLMQDHLELRAEREQRLPAVADADAVAHTLVESGHSRGLVSIFGAVQVRRLAYRARGRENLYPADAALNLPVERHSHGLRRLAAIEAARGSFDAAVEAIARATGVALGKRQVEQLAARAASDISAFYADRPPAASADPDVLVLSADGKGIVMRPDALRPATAAAAARAGPKLATRLSKGEKRNRKRMAEVGTVYDLTPVPRSPADIFPDPDPDEAGDDARPPAPTPTNKWLVASVVDDAASVIGQIFDEACRRDPDQARTWVALVDGNNHQLDRIRAEAAARAVTVSVVIDFIHVLEYLWKAAWCFYSEADPGAETWVQDKALAILAGHARQVAAAIRRTADSQHLDAARRAGADTCADYLRHKARYLNYPVALARGWPIATGVIEGACRHLVKDRMDITGARWGLPGAEAILKLRAIHANGDFDTYWTYHLTQERRRTHQNRYANGKIPQAA